MQRMFRSAHARRCWLAGLAGMLVLAAVWLVVELPLLAHAGTARTHRATSALRRGHVEIIRLRRDGVQSDIWVYRPDVPDSPRLPVIYFLHGLPGSASDVFKL